MSFNDSNENLSILMQHLEGIINLINHKPSEEWEEFYG